MNIDTVRYHLREKYGITDLVSYEPGEDSHLTDEQIADEIAISRPYHGDEFSETFNENDD
jgi:hypothetical protein